MTMSTRAAFGRPIDAAADRLVDFVEARGDWRNAILSAAAAAFRDWRVATHRSFVTGALAGAISQPADVILTLLLKARTDGNLLVRRGPSPAWRSSAREQTQRDSKLLLARFASVGVAELARGYAVRAATLGTLISMQLSIYAV